MTTSIVELEVPEAVNIRVTDGALTIDLEDCRTLSVPLDWYLEACPCDAGRAEKLGTA